MSEAKPQTKTTTEASSYLHHKLLVYIFFGDVWLKIQRL